MALREFYRPLHPDLDTFLFCAVGEERNGIPLSMLSALTRLGLDPWAEALRLSALSKNEAVEQLGRLIAEIPGISRPREEAREIALGLVGRLPKHDDNRASATQEQTRPRYRGYTIPKSSQLWVACLLLAAVTLASAVFHGGFPFGIGSP